MTVLHNAFLAIPSTKTKRPYPFMFFAASNLVMTLAGRNHSAVAFAATGSSVFFALLSVRYSVVRYHNTQFATSKAR
jgi:hypothetical protein